MTMFSDERGAELRQLFFETARELLQSLNDEALKLEKSPTDGESMRSARRVVHTLKGDAAACGFHRFSELAHELEDALALGTLPSYASLAEILFAAADTFDAMLSSYENQVDPPSAEPLRQMIVRLTSNPGGRKSLEQEPPVSTPEVVWTEYEKLAVEAAVREGKQVYDIKAEIDPNCVMPIAARQLVLNALSPMSEILGTWPDQSSPQANKHFQLLAASNRTAQELTAKCRIPTVISQVTIEPVPVTAQKPQVTNSANPYPDNPASALGSPEPPKAKNPVPDSVSEPDRHGKSAAASENILRVEASRVDNLLNLVGELIIGKSMLQQALSELARNYPKEALRGRFVDAMAFQARVLNDLQRSVMKVRMVPVEQLFRRFPRMARDVGRQCGKSVELIVSGQNTDLDKSILDAIAEPLTHLVRNAISHGIESVEERRRDGKPEHGTLRLDAYHQGNQVVVEIRDDGRGIDLQKVKNRATERRLLSPEEAAAMSDTEALQLIFRPGFSTADEITEISGRGVGLDVVESVIHRLKGTVEIDTNPGHGTAFRLKLPLTLAIIKALLFRVEQRLYAIPLNIVAEIARAVESDLHQVDNYEVLQLRNLVLPLVRLGSPPAAPELHSSRRIFVLVVSLGERKLGLLVDALDGEEELVIKAMDDQTVETDLVSGASILGDGRVVLILNIPAMVERFSRSRPETAGGVNFGLLLSQAERARCAHAAAGRQL